MQSRPSNDFFWKLILYDFAAPFCFKGVLFTKTPAAAAKRWNGRVSERSGIMPNDRPCSWLLGSPPSSLSLHSPAVWIRPEISSVLQLDSVGWIGKLSFGCKTKTQNYGGCFFRRCYFCYLWLLCFNSFEQMFEDVTFYALPYALSTYLRTI